MPELDDALPAAGAAEETPPANAAADAGAGDGSESPDGQSTEEPTIESLRAERDHFKAENARRSAEAQRQYQRANEMEARANAEANARLMYQQQQFQQQQAAAQPVAKTHSELAKEMTEAQMAGDYDRVATILSEIEQRGTVRAQYNLQQQIMQAGNIAQRTSAIDTFMNSRADLSKPQSQLYQTTATMYQEIMSDPNFLGDKSQMNYRGQWISPAVLQAATERAEARLGMVKTSTRNAAADAVDTHIEVTRPPGAAPGKGKGAYSDNLVADFEKDYAKQNKLTNKQYFDGLPKENREERIRAGRPVTARVR